MTAITDSGQKITAVRAIHGAMLGGSNYASPQPVTRLAPGAGRLTPFSLPVVLTAV